MGKPAASLTASLLARKGQAQPALGPRSTSVLTAQERALEGAKAHQAKPQSTYGSTSGREDRAIEPARPASRSPSSDPMSAAIERALAKGREEAQRKVHNLHAAEEVSMPMAEQETVVSKPPKVARRPKGSGKRVAMTVRLDHDTHLRLKVLSAHLNLSSQEIFSAALRDYMDDHKSAVKIQCACIKAQS